MKASTHSIEKLKAAKTLDEIIGCIRPAASKHFNLDDMEQHIRREHLLDCVRADRSYADRRARGRVAIMNGCGSKQYSQLIFGA